ncbi:hypothetical protein [Streptosporangium sp. CA-115845]
MPHPLQGMARCRYSVAGEQEDAAAAAQIIDRRDSGLERIWWSWLATC